MPLDGICAWKENGLSVEERIDRFFNLIDHAVDGGIALQELYSRRHLKEFILYVVTYQNKGPKMRTLTITNLLASSLVIGDPEVITFTVPPKSTSHKEVTPVQARHLRAVLDTLTESGWIRYVDNEVTIAAPVKIDDPLPPAVPPAPEPPRRVEPAEPVKTEEPAPPPPPVTEATPPVEAAAPEPQQSAEIGEAQPGTPAPADSTPSEAAEPKAPTEVEAKPTFYSRKNRNK